MTNFDYFAKAFRHNTGRALCDSGDAYGRHYDKPMPKASDPTVTLDIWRNEVSATISTPHFLSAWLEVDVGLQDRFTAWAAEHPDLSWFEAGAEFCESELHLEQLARGNPYNNENDLSQVFVYEVWAAKENSRDWFYRHDALVLIYAHTGCDVRGGYAYPLLCRGRAHDYIMPMCCSAGFYVAEGRRDGEALASDEAQALDEVWQTGYSSCPSYRLNQDIERVFHHTWDKTNDTVVVKLKTGELVKIGCSCED